jgi:hypothetical protein
MDEMLKRLMDRLTDANKRREGLVEARKAIVDVAKQEKRDGDTLTEDEDKEFRDYTEQIKKPTRRSATSTSGSPSSPTRRSGRRPPPRLPVAPLRSTRSSASPRPAPTSAAAATPTCATSPREDQGDDEARPG